jgi:hypothetical protein
MIAVGRLGPESCLIVWTLPLASSVLAFKPLGDWIILAGSLRGESIDGAGVLDSTEFNHYLITVTQSRSASTTNTI